MYYVVRQVLIRLVILSSGVLILGGKLMKQQLNELFLYLKEHDLFNGAICVYKNGEVISFYNGYETFSSSIDSNTSFEIASCSKIFTAVCIVKLASKNLLKFTDKVCDYLENFPYKTVTVEQLLNHTSGISDYIPLWHEDKIASNSDIASMFQREKPDLLFNPGSNYSYTNTGYIYLALLIERISGMAFSDFLQSEVISPLNLKNCFVGTANQNSSAMAFYKVNDELKDAYSFEDKKMYKNLCYLQGDGNIKCGPLDLMRFVLALSNNSLLSSSEFQTILKTPILSDGTKSTYGYGIIVDNDTEDGLIFSHGGSNPGCSSSFTNYVDRNAAIIYLSNAPENMKTEQEIVMALENIIFERPFENPNKVVTPKVVKVSSFDIGMLVGEYSTEEGIKISINELGGNLFLKVEGQNQFMLQKVDKTKYYIQDLNLFVKVKEKPKLQIILDDGFDTCAVRIQ